MFLLAWLHTQAGRQVYTNALSETPPAKSENLLPLHIVLLDLTSLV